MARKEKIVEQVQNVEEIVAEEAVVAQEFDEIVEDLVEVPKAPREGIQIGIDLGTANTLVYVSGRGIVFNEASVVAYDLESGETFAVGNEAARMLGRTHDKIQVSKPLHLGVISDIKAAKALIEWVLSGLDPDTYDVKESTLLICCPSEVTMVERESLINLAHDLGIEDAFIEEEVKAGVIGSGIDIFTPQGNLFIDIGGGSTDVGVLSLGDIVVSESIRVAGSRMDELIQKHVQHEHGLLIGEKTAEKIKQEIGTVNERLDPADEKMIFVAGRDNTSGLPREIEVSQEEIRDVLVEPFEEIVKVTMRVLEQTPPELSADIIESGIYTCGGGSLVEGCQNFFAKRLGIQVQQSPSPLTAIAEGTKVLLKNRGNYLVKPMD